MTLEHLVFVKINYITQIDGIVQNTQNHIGLRHSLP